MLFQSLIQKEDILQQTKEIRENVRSKTSQKTLEELLLKRAPWRKFKRIHQKSSKYIRLFIIQVDQFVIINK